MKGGLWKLSYNVILQRKIIKFAYNSLASPSSNRLKGDTSGLDTYI